MAGSFSASVNDFVSKVEKNLLSVTRSAIQDVINEAQTAVAKGGKMPVDTGFLRRSGMSHLNSLPFGPSQKATQTPGAYSSPEEYTSDPNVAVDLANLTLNDIFYFGWTAEYALMLETRYAFLDSALQNWQSNVKRRAEELEKRSAK